MPRLAALLGYGNSDTPVTTLTYGTTIAVDASKGEIFKIAATDTVAYTVSNPTNAVAGARLVFDILNSSGGTMGTITWDTLFKLAGALTKPANGKRSVIEFYYDGTNWVELNRIAADI